MALSFSHFTTTSKAIFVITFSQIHIKDESEDRIDRSTDFIGRLLIDAVDNYARMRSSVPSRQRWINQFCQRRRDTQVHAL